MTIEIKTIYGDLLHKCEEESIKDALVKLVKRGANLREANLRGADLRGANLRGAEDEKVIKAVGN